MIHRVWRRLVSCLRFGIVTPPRGVEDESNHGHKEKEVSMRLEVYRESSKRKDWRWRVRANNGKIIAVSSEGYRRHSGLLRSLERVAECIPGLVEDYKGKHSQREMDEE